MQGNGDVGVLDSIYTNLKSAKLSDDVSKGELAHAFRVAQLVMEMKHEIWISAEKSLEEERASSQKLKTALQVAKASDVFCSHSSFSFPFPSDSPSYNC